LTTVAIHQPQYLPWLPYLAKASVCDVFVYLDNVQFQQNGVQNRNQIKTASGPVWLTVPVNASLELTIATTPIVNSQSWRQKHMRSIEQAYAKAPYKDLIDKGFRQLIEQDWRYLSDLNIALTEWMFNQFDIKCQRVLASELSPTGAKDDLVIDICQRLQADNYLSGHGAKVYQSEEKFNAAGLKLTYFDYAAPEYTQCHPKQGFSAGLSALDYLFNMGADSASVIGVGNRAAISPI
jgi:hypothetical protein